MTIFIGADHRGFKLKEGLKPYLVSLGHTVIDKGNVVLDPNDDFPDFAEAVAQEVGMGHGVGILMCGSGGGMTIAANKVKGARAVEAENEEEARRAGADDNANILVFPAERVGIGQAKKSAIAWLSLSSERAERHQRRLKKIEEIEKKNFK